MKKLIFSVVALTIISVGVLSGCVSNTDNIAANIDKNAIANELATTTYISQGLLGEGVTQLSNNNLAFNSSNANLAIEEAQPLSTAGSELDSRKDQMMSYFDRIKTFLDGEPETVLSILQAESNMEMYESSVTYGTNDERYTIHYNVTDASEDNTLEESEFTLEGILEYKGVTFELIGGTEVEEGEVEMFFETHSLTNDDYIRVEIEKDAFEQYFEIETSLAGVETYSEVRLEKDGLDGAVEIYIEENGLDTYYEITKEVDGSATIYYFEYSIGSTYGSIQMTVTYNQNGDEIRDFIVEEGEFYSEYQEIIPAPIEEGATA
jgi:hypothetical protein